MEGRRMYLQAAVESTVEGLFSVLVTMGVVPIIRCPKVCTCKEHTRGSHSHNCCVQQIYQLS